MLCAQGSSIVTDCKMMTDLLRRCVRVLKYAKPSLLDYIQNYKGPLTRTCAILSNLDQVVAQNCLYVLMSTWMNHVHSLWPLFHRAGNWFKIRAVPCSWGFHHESTGTTLLPEQSWAQTWNYLGQDSGAGSSLWLHVRPMSRFRVLSSLPHLR